MITRPHVLCPIDFSPASRSALRYALAIANRFDTRLLLLTVEDALLAEAAAAKMGVDWNRLNSERELRLFLAEALGPNVAPRIPVQIEAVTGKPAEEILRVARDAGSALIVMSTHGRSGPSKYFFGSVTERVLRETTVPVLLTPPSDAGPATFDALVQSAKPVLVPVDFSVVTTHQVAVARTIASALRLPMIVTHVIEPLHVPVPAELHMPELASERLARAQSALRALGTAAPSAARCETLIVVGDAAGEIAQIARDRQVGLVVVGLHGSPFPGPRMGSVTYRILCLTPVLTLALPPAPTAAGFN